MNGPVLRDIHLPPAHWWPPAPGWWLLAALLLMAAIATAWWLRRMPRAHPLRAAMREIDALEAAHARDGNATHLAAGASRLMRRVARRIAPDVAAQTGEAWDAFVWSHAPDATTRRALDELAGERFRAQPMLDTRALLTALRAWCRNALHARSSTPFHRKGGANANAREARAPQARGDETREAKAIPLNPPSFRRGKQTPSGGKGVAPQARGDETREAEAIPFGRAARAFAALRPSFRRGKQTPSGGKGGAPEARGDETSTQYAPQKPAP